MEITQEELLNKPIEEMTQEEMKQHLQKLRSYRVPQAPKTKKQKAKKEDMKLSKFLDLIGKEE